MGLVHRAISADRHGACDRDHRPGRALQAAENRCVPVTDVWRAPATGHVRRGPCIGASTPSATRRTARSQRAGRPQMRATLDMSTGKKIRTISPTAPIAVTTLITTFHQCVPSEGVPDSGTGGTVEQYDSGRARSAARRYGVLFCCPPCRWRALGSGMMRR
jgi:hypothetical protein